MLGVLLNLGCPETLDDVHPFLFNLFADSVITILQNNTCLCVFYSLYILFPYFYLAGLTIVEQIVSGLLRKCATGLNTADMRGVNFS